MDVGEQCAKIVADPARAITGDNALVVRNATERHSVGTEGSVLAAKSVTDPDYVLMSASDTNVKIARAK